MGADRYALQRSLAQGSMSEVWLAQDKWSGAPVAFKIMKSNQEDSRRNYKTEERFRREIEIAQNLNHPHIVPVLDHGYMVHEGHEVPFLVSQYVPGGSLAAILDKQPPWDYWTLIQTVDVIVQAAECLFYLHTRQPPIVHEDVKPANFLCKAIGRPERSVELFLCDFGISRRKQPSYSMASEVLGTLEFIAPEQLDRNVDPASDQYALAVMACLLLTGFYPLQVSSREKYIKAHRYDHPRLPSALNMQRLNSPRVDEIFQRALAKDPTRRFERIIDFALELQTAIWDYEYGPGHGMRPNWTAYEPTVAVDSRGYPRDPMKREGVVFSLDPLHTSDSGVLDEPLPEKPGKGAPASTRGEAVGYQELALQGPVRVRLPQRPKQLSWAADKDELACLLYAYGPVVCSLDGVLRRVMTTNAATATSISYSPGGKVLAVASPHEIQFWDLAKQAICTLKLSFPGQTIEAIDWSSQGVLAVWIAQTISLYTLSPQTLESTHVAYSQRIATGTVRCNTRGAGMLRWSPDGTQLVASGLQGEVVCWIVVGPQIQVWQVTPAGQKVTSSAWSGDGIRLAVAFRDNRVAVWDCLKRQLVKTWEKIPAMPRVISFAPGGLLTIASQERRLLLLDEGGMSRSMPGQLLATWTVRTGHVATLDEKDELQLAIWSLH